MQDETVLAIVLTGCGAGVLIAAFSVWVTRHSAERVKRLEVMQKALAQPDVDDESRRRLLDQLAADQREQSISSGERLAQLRRFGRMILVGGGWSLFVFCGSLLVAMEGFGAMRWIPPEPVITFLIVGFVAMTVPVATRELMARSDPETVQR